MFQLLGIEREVVHQVTADKNGRLLNSLQTGPNLKIRLTQGGEFEALRYNIDAANVLTVTYDGGSARTEIERRKVTVREREVSGQITSSLFQAGAAAGLSDQFVLRLAAIFKWNIDFTRDLHPGDRFSVIFEEKFIEDRKFATGGIIAAAFVVGGKKYTAVRHVDNDGVVSYFSADGNSLKRAFLRSPVKFSRISSQFSLKRYHPILKKWRAHKGVDYAASRGTPVLATADGVVESAGRNGGYGKAIILKHGKSYSTLYGHLDKFAGKIRAGDKIRQGQVIGYVGSSGLATGPHLHYEFRVGGVHKNPLTVDVPRALPIAGAEREEFLRVAGNFDRRLTGLLN
ncbi:MAG: peptidase M23 [Proteobacteria bacterium]|nr:MAG: peptidase M23 [Pseudomonadota bacterium]